MCGKLVSWLVGDVLSEVECLVKVGVKEFLVIFQDISVYGVDLKYKIDFWNGQLVKICMKEFCEVLSSMGVWVCLYYVYLYFNVDDVILLMVVGKFLLYFDIFFQYVSLKVFKVMKCLVFEDKILVWIKQWCEICLELIICLIFIVGFLGEIEEDFQYLFDWLMEVQFDCVGCFQYFFVEGVLVNELGLELVLDEVKQDCWECFMVYQQVIFVVCLQFKVGKEIEVLIDEVDEQGVVGCFWVDVLEIDGNVFVDSDELKLGDKVCVCIIDVDEYDFWVELV